MNRDDHDEEAFRVGFEGPHARLTLTFDPASFEPVSDPEAWPRATVGYEGGGLIGMVKVHFFPWALPEFTRKLAGAHRALRGTAALESEDGDFSLTVAFGDRGDATLTGHLQPDILNGTRLVYEIETDQSYLNAALVGLVGLPVYER